MPHQAILGIKWRKKKDERKEVENSTREGSIQNNVIIITCEKEKKNSSGEKVIN